MAEVIAMRELECQACDKPIEGNDVCIWRESDGFYHTECAKTKGIKPSPSTGTS